MESKQDNKENIPIEIEDTTAENRGSTAMQEKNTAKPFQQQHLDVGQEEIIDDVVDHMPDNSAFRDKEFEELQKQKEEIEQEKQKQLQQNDML